MKKEKNFEIKLNLQKESWKRLWLMARRYGISPEELLKQFVADLTCGTGSGGSDERDLAERWYYRSFEMMGEDTFVSYLCSDEDMIEEVMELKGRIAKSEQYISELKERMEKGERIFAHKDKNGKESLIAHSWKELGYASREAWEDECEEEIREEKEILRENEENLKEIWEDFQRAKASQSATYEEEMKKLDEFFAEYRKRFY
ncbi:MAG: hypothetical protein HFI79_02965 [Lachnospiraceae bacterium]|nr:hypothetical protein [Lachnospiraceae bacterium]